MATPLVLHPDRALPADPATREVARRLYDTTRSLPLVCMHGHVEAEVLADDQPFAGPGPPARDARPLRDPHDRLPGVPLEELGVPRRAGARGVRSRERSGDGFCAHWHLFRGTPCRFWLEHELVEVFGVRVPLGRDRRRALRLSSPPASPTRTSGRARCSTVSASSSSPPPIRLCRTSAPRPASRGRAGGPGGSDVPTRRRGPPGPAPAGRARSRRSASSPVRHRRLSPVSWPPSASSGGALRRAPGRWPPTTATARRHHAAFRGRGGRASTPPRSTGRSRRRRPRRSPGTCCFVMARDVLRGRPGDATPSRSAA